MVVDFLVEESVVVDFLVEEGVVVDFLVVEVECLDFLGVVRKNLDQPVQYQRELLQVLVDVVLDLDLGNEVHLRNGLGQTKQTQTRFGEETGKG